VLYYVLLCMECIMYIVKIDSITRSFCLCHCVQNGLSYRGKETQPKLCLKGRQANSGVSSLGTNKDQLLHRIQSVWTFTNLQYILYYVWGCNVCTRGFDKLNLTVVVRFYA